MRNAEDAIAKVLTGLRDAEASPGMERRILQAIEARTLERPAARFRWTWGAAMAGLLAVSLFIAISVIYRYGQPSTQVQQQLFPAESAEGPKKALLLPRKSIEAVKPAAHMRKTSPISAEEAVLLSEMRAPSHPAPEAPLTNEERLLLRAVHTGDPQVIAMLDPEERVRQETASETEFKKFVEQSGKNDHESDQTTE